MPSYILPLRYKHCIAEHTFAFHFEKPEHFTFQAGQYGGFTLLDANLAEQGAATRRFSFLSTTADPHLIIATRIQPHSAYKQALHQLAIGQTIKFAGPSGKFILHSDHTTTAVFIAGGMGIAPFYSMIHHIKQCNMLLPIQLFYVNHSLASTAFLAELGQLAIHMPHVQYIPIMTTAHPGWHGAQGQLDATTLAKYIPDLLAPIYYLCGPPAFVQTIQDHLNKLGISQDQLKTEDFPGY